MISALSGNSALSLLSVFGRSQQTGAATQTRSAQRPPSPPPPPPSQGNGASAKSIFDALLGGTSSEATSLDDLMNQLVSSLDQNGDGSLDASEVTAGFKKAVSGQGDGDGDGDDGGLEKMVSNIISNLDTDGDKAVSADELNSGLQQMAANGPPPGGPPPGGPPPGGPPPGGAEGGESSTSTSASDIASSLISGLDTNGDGVLSADELTAGFQSQTASQTTQSGSSAQKSLQELLFGLLLDQKGQDQTSQAAALYAA